MSKSTLVASLAVSVAFAAGLVVASAGQPEQPEVDFSTMPGMAPDEHHAALEPLIGTWEADVKFWMTPDGEPMESTGTVTREWAMDGRFVIEHVTGTMAEGEGEFHGMGIIGYNTIEDRYESVWIENMATYMTFMNGELDDESNTLTFEGEMLSPMTGERVHSRHSMDLSDPNRHTALGYCEGPDGEEFKSFEGVMEKVN